MGFFPGIYDDICEDMKGLVAKLNMPYSIPRAVFEAMESEVKEKVLCDYWIPKDDTLPVLYKMVDAYHELAPSRVMWNVPFERFCAYDGAKMYKCEENSQPEFYCPVCKKFYVDKNWDIQGD